MNITPRNNWQNLKKILEENGITKLYHFTDRRNLPSIVEYGGLYSWKDCNNFGIVIEKPGGNELSHSLDTSKRLENYVRLSFAKTHPMMYIAQGDEREIQPVILEISIDVIEWIGTLISDRNATKNGAQIRNDLSHIHFDLFKYNAPFEIEDIDQQPYYQAEVLVKNCVPLDLILNMKEHVPELIKTKENLKHEEKIKWYQKIAELGNIYYKQKLVEYTNQYDHFEQKKLTLLEFAAKHGKMQVGHFINSTTGVKFKSCIFTNQDGEKVYVPFAFSLGELTPQQISKNKYRLQVLEYKKDKYLLESKSGETIDLT